MAVSKKAEQYDSWIVCTEPQCHGWQQWTLKQFWL